jgi:hypothetical protein
MTPNANEMTDRESELTRDTGLCGLPNGIIGLIVRGRGTAPRLAEKMDDIDALIRDTEVGNWMRILAYGNTTPFGDPGWFTEIEGEVVSVRDASKVWVRVTRVAEWRDDKQRREQNLVSYPEIGDTVGIQLTSPPKEGKVKHADCQVWISPEDVVPPLIVPLGYAIRVELDTTSNPDTCFTFEAKEDVPITEE